MTGVAKLAFPSLGLLAVLVLLTFGTGSMLGAEGATNESLSHSEMQTAIDEAETNVTENLTEAYDDTNPAARATIVPTLETGTTAMLNSLRMGVAFGYQHPTAGRVTYWGINIGLLIGGIVYLYKLQKMARRAV